jgi:hypothetical protein
MKARLIILGVIAVIALCVGAFFGIRHMWREAEVGKFKSIAQSYTAAQGEPDGGQPRIVGKVLPVNMADRSPDHLYFDLPDALKPSKPEDVGTVALLSWGQDAVDHYTNGATAYQQYCEVTLINHKTKKTIFHEKCVGGPPPMETSNTSSASGSSAGPEVIRWLSGLPKGDN